MATKNTTTTMAPADLKLLFESLNIAPSWISKRFLLEHYCGWSEADIQRNATLRNEEEQQSKIGNKAGAFR